MAREKFQTLTEQMFYVLLCLTQFFARGVELEQDVEGLV